MTTDQAVSWAKAQLGKYIQPCATAGCKYNLNNSGTEACSSPSASPDSDDLTKGNAEDGHALWNFYCMRFVRSAYGAPGQYPKAEDMYQDLKRQNLINIDLSPAEGALVFWHWSIYGHIGIFSNGKVIHTGVNPQLVRKGIRESLLTDVTEVMNTYVKKEGLDNSYLGWSLPPEPWLH